MRRTSSDVTVCVYDVIPPLQVTSRNEENQQYLLRAAGGGALATLSQLFQLAETELADCSPADIQVHVYRDLISLQNLQVLFRMCTGLHIYLECVQVYIST